MHTKTIRSIVATIMVLVTLAAMLPLHIAMAASGPSAAVTYDEKYVSMKALGDTGFFIGDDITGNGTKEHPWRTITKAVSMLPYAGGNPDRINVGPSGTLWYGGAVPENIIIQNTLVDNTGGKGLVIASYNPSDGTRGGAANAAVTKIDVTEQGTPAAPGTTKPQSVIEVNSSTSDPDATKFSPSVVSGTFVTIDGFTLTGTAAGITAHPVAPRPYIEKTQVYNCVIKIDQVTQGVGIEMYNVKWPVIDNCKLYVGTEGAGLTLSVQKAWGIIMVNCYYPDFFTTVTNNVVNVHGALCATGVEIDSCPKSFVNNNNINVLASGDVRGTGIKVNNSPLITLNNNTVAVEANGNTWAVAYGIRVSTSAKANLSGDNVTVKNNMVGKNFGFLFARGISIKSSAESQVKQCTVKVNSVANTNNTMLVKPADVMEADEIEDLADLSQINAQSLGTPDNGSKGVATVIGIRVKGSDMVTVSGNTVDPIYLDLTVAAGDSAGALAVGDGVAIGIEACGSGKFTASGNTVNVDTKVVSQALAIKASPAEGYALSEALGIVLFGGWEGIVTMNTVDAQADLTSTVSSVVAFTETSSAIARLGTQVVGAINKTLLQLQENSANVKLSGNLASISSYGNAGSDAVGIGIEIICNDKAAVTGNKTAGTGNLTSTVWAQATAPDNASSTGGGMGLGIGISIQDSRGVFVDSNNPVSGTGTAKLDIGARQTGTGGTAIPVTYAQGCGAGIGIGIMLCGNTGYDNEAQALSEDKIWSDRPTVSNNVVTAAGTANPVTVNSTNLVKSHEAVAIGKGMGLSLGITAWGYPCVLIKNNTVKATGKASVKIYSEAVHEIDPYSEGNASGIGIGISTVFCCKAVIQGNTTDGVGTAYADVGSLEKAVIVSALSKGASLGLGKGLLVEDCWFVLVTGNTANGVGDAETKIKAETQIPLGWAGAYSMTTGIGTGIGVVCSPFGKIVDCNTAAGVGTARLSSIAQGDFSDNKALGTTMSIDILWDLLEPNRATDQSRSDFPGRVNYNTMQDVAPLGSNSEMTCMFKLDAGLLKIGPFPLDARFNYWNAPTGPKFVGGQGEELICIGKPVCYEPWLYVCHKTVLTDQLGYFGFTIPIAKGLNTLSTPIALEQTVVPSRKWSNIVANSNLGGKIKYADRWDAATQAWVSVGPDDTLDPLDAWYVYFYDTAGPSVILLTNVNAGHPYAMPQRKVSAGWDLVGPNPLFINSGMRVNDALSSIKLTPAGLPGYTQVISPVVKGQDAWIYTPNSKDVPWMLSGRGYWVFTENDGNLAGFGFTPLPDKY